MKTTLQIKVHDTVNAEDIFFQKEKERETHRFPALVFERQLSLEELFCGVENYSRPPTQILNFKTFKKAFSFC